jgi:hypothetical protein
MGKHTNSTQDQSDADDEVRLDEEYRLELQRIVNSKVKEDTELKNNIHMFSDMRTYLNRDGIGNDIFFKNLSVNFIINHL